MTAFTIEAKAGYLVLQKSKILLRPIPKSSSTFLKRIAVWSEGRVPPVAAVYGETRPALAIHRSDLNQIPTLLSCSQQIGEEALYSDEWLRIVVVRHPAERLLSFWHDKIHLMDPAYGPLTQKILSEVNASKPHLVPKFADFVAYLSENWAALKHDSHLTPQFELSSPNDLSYGEIIQRDNIAKDLLPCWLDRLAPEQAHLIIHEHEQYDLYYRQRLSKRWPEIISQDTCSLIKSLYQGDFDIFGFEIPRRRSSKVKSFPRNDVDALVDPLQQIRDRNAQIAELQRQLNALSTQERKDNFSDIENELFQKSHVLNDWPQHSTPGSGFEHLYPLLLQGLTEALELEISELENRRPENGEAVYLSGLVHQMKSQYNIALEKYERSTELDFLTPYVLFNSANCHRGLRNYAKAFESYRRALQMLPDFPECELNMANTHIELGEFDAAIAILRRLVIRRPDYSQGSFALGNCLRESGRPLESVHAYRLCLEHNPSSCDALNNLGLAHGALNEQSKARDCYTMALSINSSFRPARQNLAQWLVHAKRHDEALAKFRDLAADANTSTERISSFQGQISCLLELSDYDKALQLADDEPIELLRLIKRLHVLPILYQTSVQIAEVRSRFSEDLRRLNEHFSKRVVDPELYQEVYEHTWALTNFYLAYQMLNDRPLQEDFAVFLTRVVEQRLGGFMKPLQKRKTKGQEVVKIGIISPHLKNHNGSIWSLGWLTDLIPDPAYEIYSYNLGEEQDPGTERFKAISKYRHLPMRSDNAEQHLKLILEDRLDVLIFTDIGMHPSSKITSVLRLAPIQAQGWGHPITSGSPTMDYFLGAEGMEPEGNEEHYSEALVRLPNTGLYYERPAVVHDGQCLFEKFDLPRDRPLLLSLQSTFKYIPANDKLFVDISERHPNSLILFVGHMGGNTILGSFKERLSRAYEEASMDMNQFVKFLPRLDYADYMGLFCIGHHTLDTVDWNGGNSSFQSFSLGCPVVTLPTEFMRGRHTVSMLLQMGIPELIAETRDDYVAISSRLLNDSEFYQEVRAKILERQSSLFCDVSVSKAFKTWIDGVIA